MAFTLPAPRYLVIGIAVNRGGKDFTERERLHLNLLSPHLIQAYRNAEAFTQMQNQMALVNQTLERLDQGIVVLTRDGRVALANARAIQWITTYFGGRSARGNRLPESLERWVKHQEALTAVKDDVPPPQGPLAVEREGKRLLVRYLCDRSQGLLLLEEHQTTPSPQTLTRLRLTHREADVLFWVARGKTNMEIATIVGLSARTVQKHLEHIYQKLGVENRTAAAARAFEVIGRS